MGGGEGKDRLGMINRYLKSTRIGISFAKMFTGHVGGHEKEVTNSGEKGRGVGGKRKGRPSETTSPPSGLIDTRSFNWGLSARTP